MPLPLEELKKIRLEKLKQIRELGIDPYPAKAKREQSVAGALKMMGKKVAVVGRIWAVRGHGGIQFFDLQDESGKIQLVFKQEDLKDKKAKLLGLLDRGDFIAVQGKVFETKAGETSVEVEDFQLLTKSIRSLPSKWHGLKDVEERYRQRYVDLVMNPEAKKIAGIRSKILTGLRNYLDTQGFLEVETPVLQSVYGGAAAKPFVTHHNTLDCDFYLRISDELYLKRLIVGGFEKVYEVSKDFRNEGIDRIHNPEFTMIEFYWAYATYEDLMKLTEEMISQVLKETMGTTKVEVNGKTLDFTPPLPRVQFCDLLLEETGIDIDKIEDEKKLREEIKKKKVEINLEGVVGLVGILDKLHKEKIRPKIKKPSFLVDYSACMIALAKRKVDNPKRIATFQLLAEGVEIIKAYNELNDPLDQRQRWEETSKLAERGEETAEIVDEDFIRALEYGMPPTAGWGMGLDRFVSIITNKPLKEVILFPTLRPKRKKK